MKVLKANSFSKTFRLRAEADFASLRFGSKKINGRYIHLYYKIFKERGHCRVAFSISKKVGAANFRNTLKRQFREHIRHHKQFKSMPIDVLFVVKPIPKIDNKPIDTKVQIYEFVRDMQELSSKLCERF